MFAVRRIIRSKFSLNKHIYTNSVIRCDKPNDTKSEDQNLTEKEKSAKHKAVIHNKSKNKLTAKLNAKDYANFKNQNVELYLEKTSKEEKSKANEALKALTKEVESEVNVDTPTNEKFNTLAVPKPKVRAESDENLVKSAKKVALHLGGNPEKTEGDILGFLKSLQLKTERRKFERDNANTVGKEKQIGKYFKGDGERPFKKGPGFRDRWAHSGDRQEQQQMQQSYKMRLDEQNMNNRRKEQGEPNIKDIILGIKKLGSQKLGILKASHFKNDGLKLKTWDELEELELMTATKIPPQNHFEELIQWTKEGKLWHFPIDNDQDNEVEANVDFTEHVFLEEHLEPWCPKKGPLRHFMELVLVGLSKNHYFSVEEKKEHIYWYRDYFEGKKKLLQEMGIFDSVKVLQESSESNSKPESPA